MSDIIQDTLDVVYSGQTFTFKLPNPRDVAKMGTRALALRREDGGFGTGGIEFGLDPDTMDLYRGFALLETLLIRADAKDNWPYSQGPKGEPVVDSSKFPPSVDPFMIAGIYRAWEVAHGKFLGRGLGDNEQPGT